MFVGYKQLCVISNREVAMVIRVSPEASDEFKRIYRKYPDICEREVQLLDDLLYRLSDGSDVNLTVVDGSLLMQKGWK